MPTAGFYKAGTFSLVSRPILNLIKSFVKHTNVHPSLNFALGPDLVHGMGNALLLTAAETKTTWHCTSKLIS